MIIENWNSLKAFDRLTIIFFGILNVGILAFPHHISHPVYQFLKHLVIMLLIFFFIPYLDRQKGNLIRLLRHWYLIVFITFIYWDVGNFIHLIHDGYFDNWIIHFENHIFGEVPNIWIQRFVNPPLTEIMQLSYATYWFTIPAGAGILYIKKEYELFDRMLYYVLLTFFISYLIFILFPVSGPRFTLTDKVTVSYKGLWLAPLLRNFVSQAGLRGGAFPSSHVAVAIVILIFMWKHFPKIGKRYFLPVVIALSMATIYGQYHYVTDVIAGFILGTGIGLWSIYHGAKQPLQKKMPIPEQAPASVLNKY